MIWRVLTYPCNTSKCKISKSHEFTSIIPVLFPVINGHIAITPWRLALYLLTIISWLARSSYSSCSCNVMDDQSLRKGVTSSALSGSNSYNNSTVLLVSYILPSLMTLMHQSISSISSVGIYWRNACNLSIIFDATDTEAFYILSAK